VNDLINSFGPVLFVVFLVVVGVLLTWMRFQRAATMIRDWAAREGLELVDKEYCWFWPGPFLFRKSKGQMVYRVRVRDADGQEYSGYVRLGGWFLGMWSDEVAVEWDR
jgi:hypothetical protein